MKTLTKLFSPIRIAALEVKNRIVMPPMHTGFGGADGSVTQRIIDYYEARAKGGVGIIIVEAATVNPLRKYAPNALGLFDNSLISGWKRLVQAIHDNGAKIAVQLLDPGPFGSSRLSGMRPVGPSAVLTSNTWELPRELSIDEIQLVIHDFTKAARRAKEAGLDAVEIHAAHGFAMVGAFLSSLLNKRTDSYGGSLEGRLKFLLDVIKGIRADVGNGFPIVVRISGDDRIPGGRTLQETQFIAPMIVEAGASALEISGGTVPDAFWAVVPPAGTPLALNAGSAAAVKQVVEVPVISVGRINDPHIAQFVLETGKADMVSMGRALIADPELPLKAYEGHFEDIRPCVADNQGCLGVPTVQRETSCIVNPAAGREKEMEIVPVDVPRNVLVVGGGPSGMETARVASLRGHEVTLIEKEEKLGGQINLASIPPSKQEMCKLVKYLSIQMEKAGVTVRTGREASSSLIDKVAPDVVVVATGGSPIIPDDIPGMNKEGVVTAWDVLAGKTRPDGKVVILGGGSVGCETADFLASSGDNLITGSTTVTILEMQRNVAMDMAIQSRHLLMQRLREKGVRIITSCKVEEILDDNALKITKDGGEEIMHHADHIVLALGTKAVNNLSEVLKEKVYEIHVIGDAKRPRTILEAIAEGAEIAQTI